MKLLLKSYLLKNNFEKDYKSLCLIAKGFILLCLPQFIHAQVNLVPNPSFEFYSQCPVDGKLIYAQPWYPVGDNGASYFNACAPYISGYNVPSGLYADFQYARTGVAYAAIFTYNYNDNRNNIQVKLIDSLISGKCYYVEFFVSLTNTSMYAINNVAAHLSKDSIFSTSSGTLLNLQSHIMLAGNPIITDTLNWTRISGIYIAKGGELFITIGNFNLNSQTDTLRVLNTPDAYGGAHYIDDVSVIEINGSYEPITSYRDTTINEGDSVYIGTRISGINCTWYKAGVQIADSVPGITVAPTVTTTYTLTQKIPCSSNIKLDTIVVTVIPKPVNIVESLKFKGLSVWPNPSKGLLNIKGLNEKATIVLYNTLGEKVIEVKSQEIIDVSGLVNGVYFMKVIIIGTNEITVKKLVVSHK
jgi:hypothetical protein